MKDRLPRGGGGGDGAGAAALPGTEAKIAFLRQPAHYPEATPTVQVVETHISWVFLTQHHAYKLKKPVRHTFLDFSTLEARHRDCEEEVRLNRRLAPDTYLGTVALVLGEDGRLALGGAGRVVDWLVWMRRLPEERMLDRLIRGGAVRDEDIGRLVAILARFYGAAAPAAMAPAAYRRRIEDSVRADAQELLAPSYGLPADSIHLILAAQLAMLRRQPELFEARAGRIVEGHGDLRPEHICLKAEPAIIDCLEFNRDFRILDPADELAFLALECERLGGSAVGRRILEGYRRASGDDPPQTLLSFYMSYRACLRAKLAAWHLGDPQVLDPARWLDVARQYLADAERHLSWVS